MSRKKKQKKSRTSRTVNPNSLGFRIGRVIGTTLTWYLVVLILAAFFALTLWLLAIPNWAELIARFNFNISVEYLQIVTWPVVVIVALIVMRKEIVALIRRITKLSGPGGVTAEISPQQTSANDNFIPPDEALSTASDSTNESSNDDVDVEAAYNNPIVQLHFEKTYRNIFGSQIELLYLLNGSSEGYDEDALDIYLARHNERRIGGPITFNNYISYLLSNTLVLRQPDGTYQITVAGQLFIRYLVDQGLGDPARKPL